MLTTIDDMPNELGLGYNERVTLQVRYETEEGEPLGAETVEFSLVATGVEDTVGSTLSAASATTNEQGVATVDLVAGAENASFRVAIDAPYAATAFVIVEISDGGFAQVRITPVHIGWRPVESFTRVDVRLYRPSEVSCAQLDIDTLSSMSSTPARTLDGFGGTVEYPYVSAGQARVVVAWARVADSASRSAVGCVDIAPGQLLPGAVEFAIVMDDRQLLADRAPVRTRYDLNAVADHLRALGADRPWQVLEECDAGLGQLLLDCTLDALVPDGQLDCQPGADSGLALAVAARRGPADVDGCRPLMDGEGAPALDALVSDAVVAGDGFPHGDALTAVLAARTDIAAGFTLESQMSISSGSASGGGGTSLVRHELVAARAALTSGESVAVELLASARPVVIQDAVATAWDGPHAELAEHRFTLRYGQVAADAFAHLGLETAGVSARADSLGQLLSESISHGMFTGCQGLSQLVCTDIGQSGGCLVSACEEGAQALDQRFGDWWRMQTVDGYDLAMSGSLTGVDDDGDRLVEHWLPGAGQPAWSATMWLADGSAVPIAAALLGEP